MSSVCYHCTTGPCCLHKELTMMYLCLYFLLSCCSHLWLEHFFASLPRSRHSRLTRSSQTSPLLRYFHIQGIHSFDQQLLPLLRLLCFHSFRASTVLHIWTASAHKLTLLAIHIVPAFLCHAVLKSRRPHWPSRTMLIQL